MKKLYVGNLSYNVTDEELAQLFAAYGEVVSAKIIRDKFDDSSKGFGFVEMADDNAAMQAMEALDGNETQGRALRVNEAREKSESGGGNRGGGGGGGRGGFNRGRSGGGGGGNRGGGGGGNRGGGGGGGRW